MHGKRGTGAQGAQEGIMGLSKLGYKYLTWSCKENTLLITLVTKSHEALGRMQQLWLGRHSSRS